MAGCRQLGLAGPPLTTRVIARLVLLVLVLTCPALAGADDGEALAAVRQLYADGRWEEIVRLVATSDDDNPELNFYQGMALARLERWEEADGAFAAGARKSPGDPRFPVERAGVAYKQGRRGAAKAQLRQALDLDPANPYAHEFLATIYFLEENLEAALKHWNRVNKPALVDFRIEPEPRLRAELQERAARFSLGGVWTQEKYLATRARFDNLGVFARQRFQLAVQPDGTFHAVAHSVERNGLGGGKVAGLIALLRGLPYQTTYPEFYNVKGTGMNFLSLVRWDSQKRRSAASLTWPLAGNPARRAKIYFGMRNENWDVSRTVSPSSGAFAGFNLLRFEGGAELRSVVNGRFSWSSGLHFAHRRFRNPQGLAPGTTAIFTDGFSVDYSSGVDISLLRIPERRFFLQATGSGRFGRFSASPRAAGTAGPSGGFGGVEGGLHADWLPRARGDDYHMQARFRTGGLFGSVPFDEFFMLGLERDNDLWLRAHVGTRDGRKGDAPLGRRYVLLNWELDKNLYKHALFTLQAGPFVDGGTVADDSGAFSSRRWLWDSGAQAKLRILGGITVTLVYGRDLRTGRNTFYTLVSRADNQP